MRLDIPPESETTDTLRERFDVQRAACLASPPPDLALRLDRLARLERMTEREAPRLIEAIREDFGHRSTHETRLIDFEMILSAIRHARKHLRGWMKTRRAPTSLSFRPGCNVLMRQPLGVVGVIAPWNYPYQLSMGPVVPALAAGNRVMVKLSEFTPRFAQAMREAAPRYFQADEFAIVTGGVEAAEAFSQLPFDHLVFTGSTAVGRRVALAAAANLTPVTLELGGKSPAIIDPSADLDAAAASLVYGKLLNAGQTCIAPDYALVPAGLRDAFAKALIAAAQRLFPAAASNPDYTSIINERQYRRLTGLIGDARKQGALCVPLGEAGKDAKAPLGGWRLPPTLMLDVKPDMAVMREEIFGPILPVLTYGGDVGEAITFVAARDRPLALYWYGRDTANRDRVLSETVSGGVTVNDCLWHFGQESQPFGGVGASGIGAYHGEWGFRALSKEKPVFLQSRINGMRFMYPPYGARFEQMLKLLRVIG
ncbi:coniferyl aldehyde dehydrogenase [Caballeronia terrestris]